MKKKLTPTEVKALTSVIEQKVQDIIQKEDNRINNLIDNDPLVINLISDIEVIKEQYQIDGSCYYFSSLINDLKEKIRKILEKESSIKKRFALNDNYSSYLRIGLYPSIYNRLIVANLTFEEEITVESFIDKFVEEFLKNENA